MPEETVLTKEEIEEKEHFRRVIGAFKAYKHDSNARLSRSQMYLKRLPLAHQQLLIKHGFKTNLENLESCIELNNNVLAEMISDAATMFDYPDYSKEDIQRETNISSLIINEELGKREPDLAPSGDGPKTSVVDFEKLQSTLKQFVRDWSEAGKEEREMCYAPILKELEDLYPANNKDNSADTDSGIDTSYRNNVKILVPGAGLGRLAYDIAKMGFECQGNEFSLYMLFGSNYVLNRCKTRNCTEIYPWIHQFTNNFKREDMISSVTFPDVDPSDIPEEAQFSMVAGDFLEVYGEPEYENSRDVVVTCFFLDTAHNVLDYIELIYKILKPGGHWINLGPLLYHFADIPREPSIEPPYDIVKNLITVSGFEFLKEKVDHKAKYCQNPKSMLQYYYNCIFFTCVKKDT